MNRHRVWVVALLAGLSAMLFWAGSAFAQQRYYQFTSLVEGTDKGKILQQAPAQGWLMLSNTGAYALQYGQSKEQGSFRFVPAEQNKGRAVIFFQSSKGRKFFAYPHGNNLMIWVRQTPKGTHLFLNASAAQPPAAQQGQPPAIPSPGRNKALPPIANGRFTATVMYGDTSAPNYLMYDRATGQFSANEKGLIFRPNGTFAIRTELGNSVFNGSGVYQISGNRVGIKFQDGSSMVLTFDQGGKKLNWYGENGMLISEFFYFGTAK